MASTCEHVGFLHTQRAHPTSTSALAALEEFGRKVDAGGAKRKQSNGRVILGDTDTGHVRGIQTLLPSCSD